MKKSRKLLSLVLAILLCVGMLPMSVLTVSAVGHSHCVCGGNTNIGDHTTHTNISFDEWNSTDSMPDTTGNYVLMNDVTITSQWKPANNIVLCLNGFDLLFESSIRQSTIQLEGIENFTLCDCQGTGRASHTNGTFGRGANIYEGVFIMYGGNISDNNVNDSGGGVNVGGTFKMYGGSISNNETETNGGGIYVFGNCTIYGGEISSNASSADGGGVAVYGGDGVNGTFTMLGGVIKNNTSDSYGGGVSVGIERRFNADITVGGTAIIKDNTVGTNPNNLHLHYSTIGNEKQLVTVSDMSADAKIGISMDTDKEGMFSNGGKDYADKFFSDNGAYAVAVDGEDLELLEKTVQVGMVTLGNGEYTTDGRDKAEGTPTVEGYAYYTGGVLKLNNFEYEGSGIDDPSVIYSEHDFKINIIGANTITAATGHGIFTKADLDIYGNGVSLDDCYLYSKGLTGLSVGDGCVLNIGNGHYITEGSHEYYSALLAQEHNLKLPASYYYRTSKTDDFTGGELAYAEQDIKYIEIYTEGWNIPAQIEWSVDSLTYNGTEQAITATIKNKADVNDDVELVLSGNKGTNANTYTATVTGLTGGDAVKYTLVADKTLQRIGKSQRLI